MKEELVHVIGAGPAGLTAAITLARAGRPVVVYEQKDDAGRRFHGDFQGLDNWSSKKELPDFLCALGIEINFRCAPYSVSDYYDPRLRRTTIRNTRPLFYLVERGGAEHALDQGLKRQALAAGVQFCWNHRQRALPAGPVIVGTGPKAADIIAKGIVFDTTHEDCSIGFLDDRLAAKGYAYLLVHRGRATFATCLFSDFKRERDYFERALDALLTVKEIDIEAPREFGGFGCFFLRASAMRDRRVCYVGEDAGFQDALWGFGLKYAMLSGHLAAQSILDGISYDRLCKEYIRPRMRTALVNRWLFARLGNRGYERLIRHVARQPDPVDWLRRQYAPRWWKRPLFPLAHHAYSSRLLVRQCQHEQCDCVWCRHCRSGEMEGFDCADRVRPEVDLSHA